MKIRVTMVLECADETSVVEFGIAKAAVSAVLERQGFDTKRVTLSAIDPDIEDVSDERLYGSLP